MTQTYDKKFIKAMRHGIEGMLHEWGLPPDSSVSLLNISENATFVARAPAGKRAIIVRVHRPGYHTRQEIESELCWIDSLCEAGIVSTAAPLTLNSGGRIAEFSHNGRARMVVGFEFLRGSEPAPRNDLKKDFFSLGAITARLHDHTQGWTVPPGFIRKTWDFDSMLGSMPLWGDWRKAMGLDEKGLRLLEKTAALLKKHLAAYGKENHRFGLIHADLRLANLLVDGNTLNIIDFDDCGFSWFMYDFAAAISFIEEDPQIPELQAGWVAGYRSVKELSETDEAAIPTFIMLRRILLTAWIASHAETETARQLGPAYTNGTIRLAIKYLDTHNHRYREARTPMTPVIRKILDMNAFDASQNSARGNPLLERRLQNFGSASILFYRAPIEMVRAHGAWMVAGNGKQYLDFYNNVPSVGHCHPRVVDAISDQVATLNIHTRYLTRVLDDYVEALKATLPDHLDNLLLACTGSEANDLALRIAAKWTGKRGFIVTETAYHGNTLAVTEISPAALKKNPLSDHVVAVPPPSPLVFGDGIGIGFSSAVAEAIATLDRRGYGLAALICDSIFSSDGVFSDPAGFLVDAVEAVRQAGGLYIADEVQPGFARTGQCMWGFQRHSVRPDMVTMGKPMGNGFPMAAVAARSPHVRRFCEDVGYFNTFGGNPVAAAAGQAVLDIIHEERLMENALHIGAQIVAGLNTLRATYPVITAIRGCGLFIGTDLCTEGDPGRPDQALTTDVINGLKDRGVLIGAAGKYGNTLKLRPPLCLTADEASIFLNALEDTLGGIR